MENLGFIYELFCRATEVALIIVAFGFVIGVVGLGALIFIHDIADAGGLKKYFASAKGGMNDD